MMKKLLLLSFFLIQNGLYAQNISKWNLGLEFSWDQLNLAEGIYQSDYLVTLGTSIGYNVDFNQFNYSLGFTGQYKFNEKLGLSTGLLYSNKDFTGAFDCSVCFLRGRGIPNPRIIEQQFLSIPLSLDYSLSTGRLRPVLTGGFRNNIEIKNDLEEYSKGYFLEGFLGASVKYDLAEKLNAGIGYRYQTALSDLYKTDEFNLRTSSLFLQLNYVLK
ncbi:outer membrane beta-barrel protein [Echinicola shivajiensis]|uniref:outer membrane beta-barrel protein n=1 Tax=Echinicola shivajiensis TaxID=1035916 RepID=UPI001BFC19E0|nr:outer membrane beta-barrel protein [Echinicola shivajiensis]